MSTGSLPPELLTLLESADAEAKRSGGSGATALDLASALARRNPEVVEEVLGAGAAARIRAGAPASVTDAAPSARALLERSQSADTRLLMQAILDSVPNLRAWLSADATVGAAEGVADVETPAAPAQPEFRRRPDAGRDPRGLLRVVEPDPDIVGRTGLVDEVLALLTRRAPATPLLVGDAGVGKTAVLGALAARIADGRTTLGQTQVLRLSVDALLGDNPVQVLDRVLDAAKDGEIIAVDDIEAALGLGTGGAIGPMLLRLRAAVDDPAVRLVLIADRRFVGRLSVVDEELAGELTRVEVEPLPQDVLQTLAEKKAAELAEHHRVTVPKEVAWLASTPAGASDAKAHPGLLIDRLDTACARARLRTDHTVIDRDLGLTADPAIAPLDAASVAAALRERVKG